MILMFGPAGSGKSLQGQILAARHDYHWISMGKVLRRETDPLIQEYLSKGQLLPSSMIKDVLFRCLDSEKDLSKVILDGFPRNMEQAEMLIDYLINREGRIAIETVLVIDLGRDEVLKRLTARGRSDDTPDAIAARLDIFATTGEEVLSYLNSRGVRINRISGNRTVGRVYDSIEEALGLI